MDGDDDVTRLRRELHQGAAEDATFDALYAEPIRARSSRFWTPVMVASRAARLLAHHDVRRVLDVGSGPGKFCLAAACVCPDVEFIGVEHRPHLVEAARLARARLGVENARFFAGDVTRLSWLDFDGLYAFNPFAENTYNEDEHLDQTVELSTTRFIADVNRVAASLATASVGMVMVTYHGVGVPIPVSYELVHAERAHSDWLRVWVKRRRDDGTTFYVEDGDDLLIVSDVEGQTVTTRMPCGEVMRHH